MKGDRDLYFVNTQGEVAYYDLDEILNRLRFKQELWGIKNYQKPVSKFGKDVKEIAEGPGEILYSLTDDGLLCNAPTRGGVQRYPDFKIDHTYHDETIFFTSFAATGNYVCVAGYMPGNQHNCMQLVKADLSALCDGPKMANAHSGHVHNTIGIRRKGIDYFVFSCYYREIFIYSVENGKLFESLRLTLDGGAVTKANHGICFEYGDQDNFEKLIIFGQGYIKTLTLKYD